MSVPLRSKQGCWTCRLRKKKCDEERPLCLICTSLSITCYGYGPKPTWMNDPEQERAVANNLKEIVRHTSRHKSGRQSSKSRTSTTLILAPKPLNVSTGSSSVSESETNRPAGVSQNASHSSLKEIGGRRMQMDGLSVSMFMFYQTLCWLISARALLRLFLGMQLALNYASPLQRTKWSF